jgi:hypothetical protein
MKFRIATIAAALALAVPALAAPPTEMSDTQLESVAGGTQSLAPVTAINVNASPIILTQTAVALNMQSAELGVVGKGHGHGKALGHLKQDQLAVAANTAKINYHVVQVNNVH